MVKIAEIVTVLGAKIVCGKQNSNKTIKYGFASDLMSDVLTLDTDKLLLVTGLNNLQTIRTAEMSDIEFILFVRNKKVTTQMQELALEHGITLIECEHSMFKACGVLYENGVEPVY